MSVDLERDSAMSVGLLRTDPAVPCVVICAMPMPPLEMLAFTSCPWYSPTW